MNFYPADWEGLDELLEELQRSRTFDFASFKRSGLARRIRFRMAQLGIRDFGGYASYLKGQSDEIPLLFNAILINVSSFFRDPAAWRFLSRRIIPRILAAKGKDEPVRVWSAGCSSGQEVYSLAMLFAQAMGAYAFRRKLNLFGSDVDDAALTEARRGSYAPKEMAGVPAAMRSKFFRNENGRFVFSHSLRSSIYFSHHDMIHDTPFSHLDLLACRNTLIYFNGPTQRRVLARFHIALRDRAYLFLGTSETPWSDQKLFCQESAHHHVFAKLAMLTASERLAVLSRAGLLSTPTIEYAL